MKTKEEIQKEFEALKDILEKVKPTTMFGDDNVAAVDAQINVLENYLDDDEIYDKYDRTSSSEYILSSALDAREWINGEFEEDSLATGWPLKKGEFDG